MDMSQIPFREIYKSGWLRKLPPERKLQLQIPPKKVWVVFCIHNGTDPYIETYVDKKASTDHKADFNLLLTGAQHITSSICASLRNEFDFVITLPTESVRFAAPTWNIMMSWVKGLNTKLIELGIISPKENTYTSHLPENRIPLLPTRDPNSPLPIPPTFPIVVPGVEPLSQTQQSGNEQAVASSADELSTSSDELSESVLEPLTVTINDSANVTVIEVNAPTTDSASPFDTPATNDSSHWFNFAFVNEALDEVAEEETEDIEFTPPSTPMLPGSVARFATPLSNHTDPEPIDAETNTSTNHDEEIPFAESNMNLYEHVFLSTSSSSSPIDVVPNIQSAASSDNAQLPRMGRGRGNSRSRRNIPNSDNNPPNNLSAIAADWIRNVRSTPYPHLMPVPHPFARQKATLDLASNTRMTLKEQQVLQLRREMAHAAGVRLQLRKKDCLSSIAFVDAFQVVWIAGWKQKEHPVLYNAFHIGDQLISLGGKMVYTAADANKLIRSWPSLYIEFVIRRVPCGRVFVLKRELEGQSLGLIQEGNTAEIKDILANSIASKQGLPARTKAMDGISFTNWVLTEINGRPLNLYFKDNEVKDRLNAVGLEISLLGQPYDLVKQLKKQLKTIKNYKDYLVQ